MKDQLLHAPIGSFSGVDFVFRGAGQLVGAGEVLEPASGAADDPKHFPIERKLKDPPGEGGFPDEQHLVGAGRDADRIGSPDQLAQSPFLSYLATRELTYPSLM